MRPLLGGWRLLPQILIAALYRHCPHDLLADLTGWLRTAGLVIVSEEHPRTHSVINTRANVLVSHHAFDAVYTIIHST